jgi:hypothetical protein
MTTYTKDAHDFEVRTIFHTTSVSPLLHLLSEASGATYPIHFHNCWRTLYSLGRLITIVRLVRFSHGGQRGSL